MINTVIFDMDGVLIDSEVVWVSVFQKMIAPFNKTMTTKYYADTHLGKTINENMKHLIRSFDLPYTVEEATDKVLSLQEAEENKGVDLKPGALSLLQYLKERNYTIVLATSSPRKRIYQILEANNVLSYFDGIACGDDVKQGKPAPDVFLKALETVGAKAEHALVLEDSDSGIIAANTAGIRVICVPDLRQPVEECKKLCTDIVPHLDYIVPFLESEIE